MKLSFRISVRWPFSLCCLLMCWLHLFVFILREDLWLPVINDVTRVSHAKIILQCSAGKLLNYKRMEFCLLAIYSAICVNLPERTLLWNVEGFLNSKSQTNDFEMSEIETHTRESIGQPLDLKIRLKTRSHNAPLQFTSHYSCRLSRLFETPTITFKSLILFYFVSNGSIQMQLILIDITCIHLCRSNFIVTYNCQ